jgi:purine nucleoside permease
MYMLGNFIRISLFFLSGTFFLFNSCTSPSAEPDPIKIRVVVVNMFELGEDSGDTPGEMQYWVEKLPLPDTLPFQEGYHHLRYNAEKGVLGLLTGVGNIKSAAAVTALGNDPRFDLTEAYWLVAGIAGVDPENASIGSAIWTDYVVDGDLGHEIDPREIPENWQTGYLPLRANEPYEQPQPDNEGSVFVLNKSLARWALELTQDLPLEDNEDMQRVRSRYINHPEAQKPPKILLGAQLSALTYWHGKYLNQWANNWVGYWTQSQSDFISSAMEDTGTAQALQWLDNAGKADYNRLMILRTASNFTMQHPDISAAVSLSGEKLDGSPSYSAYIPALEAAYELGSKVVEEILGNWETYRVNIPEAENQQTN